MLPESKRGFKQLVTLVRNISGIPSHEGAISGN
jgi:hypothetical protein